MPDRVWPGFGDAAMAEAVLAAWRQHGPGAARSLLAHLSPPQLQASGPLVQELLWRLQGHAGPRLLVDGVWFCRAYGGITRVWEQVLRCWSLPELVTPEAPVRILDRESHLALLDRLDTVEAEPANPLDWTAIRGLAADNQLHAQAWAADVFLSSWISTCGESAPAVPELALVHDCIPEQSASLQPELRALRQRWLAGASGFLTVSAATAQDLERFRQLPSASIPWCHLAPDPIFGRVRSGLRVWSQLKVKAGLRQPYVLLPATSSIGSYKNPELVAQALLEPGLETVQLVLSGLAASTHSQALLKRWPALQERLVVVGFTDLQLVLAYHHALAVVLPSRIEGFGLPALEALAAGSMVLVADSRGLREAGGGACPRFDPEQPTQLAAWLRLLLDPISAEWLMNRLRSRRRLHLHKRNPDLFGLALLALARRLSGCESVASVRLPS
jgi:glycosyltransferase involved in cell wall biosynthesis